MRCLPIHPFINTEARPSYPNPHCKSALQIRITSLRSVLARESRQFITFLLVAVIDYASHYPFYAGRNP